MKIDYKRQGKRNLEMGRRFEQKVRKFWENNGWVVSKWVCNVDLKNKKLVPAKQGRFRKTSTGFPDFIIFRPRLNHFASYKSQIPEVEIGRENLINDMENECKEIYEIMGVECRSSGYLTKEEKRKAEWLLENHIFSKIIISSKGNKRDTIKHKEFEC